MGEPSWIQQAVVSIPMLLAWEYVKTLVDYVRQKRSTTGLEEESSSYEFHMSTAAVIMGYGWIVMAWCGLVLFGSRRSMDMWQLLLVFLLSPVLPAYSLAFKGLTTGVLESLSDSEYLGSKRWRMTYQIEGDPTRVKSLQILMVFGPLILVLGFLITARFTQVL